MGLSQVELTSKGPSWAELDKNNFLWGLEPLGGMWRGQDKGGGLKRDPLFRSFQKAGSTRWDWGWGLRGEAIREDAYWGRELKEVGPVEQALC